MFCRYPVHISKCVIHPCKETCTKLCENIFLSTWMFLLHGETHRAIFANCSIFNLCLCVDKRWCEMKFTSIVGWEFHFSPAFLNAHTQIKNRAIGKDAA